MEISLAVALISWFAMKLQSGGKPILPIPGKMAWPLIAYVFICVLSFFWSEYPKESARGILKVVKHFLIFLIAADIFSQKKRLQLLEQVLTCCVLVLALDGFVQYVFGRDFIRGFPLSPSGSGPRVTASFKTYGLLASYIICVLPLIFMLLQRDLKRRSINWLLITRFIAVCGLFILLIWTRSRGAYVALFMSVTIVLLIKKKFLWLVLLILLIPISLKVLPTSMILHLDIERREQSLLERFYLWDRAIQVIQAQPWTGTGINTYTLSHKKYDQTQNWRVKNYYAHNGYLQLTAETGIPSLILFICFILIYLGSFLKIIAKMPAQAPVVGLFTGIMSFLFMALVDTVFHNPIAVTNFWFLLGVGYAYIHAARQPHSNEIGH